jgi:hypothetical protein
MRRSVLATLALVLCATGSSASGQDKQPRRASGGDLIDPWGPRKAKPKAQTPKPRPTSRAHADLVDPFAAPTKPAKKSKPVKRPKPERPRAPAGGELLDPWSR